MINFIKYARHLTGIKEDLSNKHLSEDYLTPPTIQDTYQVYKEVELIINDIRRKLEKRAIDIAAKIAKATKQEHYSNNINEIEISSTYVVVSSYSYNAASITFEKDLLGVTDEQLEIYCKSLELDTKEKERQAQEKEAICMRQKKEKEFERLKKELGK